MRNLFDDLLAKVSSHIKSLSPSALRSENILENVLSRFKLTPPELVLENTTTQIQQEIMSFDNSPPPGISFTPGRPMDVAFFSIPISDPSRIFGDVTKGLAYDKSFFPSADTLIIKKYSSQAIVGNDKVMGQLRDQVKATSNTVVSVLDNFKLECSNFNEVELKEHISNEIERKIKEDDSRSSSEEKLNPFK